MIPLLMIGAGIQERQVHSLAKGFKILTVDRDPSASPNFVVDGTDSTLIAKMCGPLSIDGVFTFTELVVPVAEVAYALRLPGVGLLSAGYAQDKGCAAEIWQDAGVSTPKTGVFRLGGKTLIKKPLVGAGAIGIEDIGADFLLQEKLNGTHHDVNALFYDGDFIPLGITDRFFDGRIETEVRAPSSLTPEKQKSLYALVQEGAHALGIDWGPVKADAMLCGGIFSLLEIAPRLHGPRNSLMTVPATGFNPVIPALNVIAGKEPVGADIHYDRCAIGRTVFERPAGHLAQCVYELGPHPIGLDAFCVVSYGDSFEKCVKPEPM